MEVTTVVGSGNMPILLDHSDVQCKDGTTYDEISNLTDKSEVCDTDGITITPISVSGQRDTNFTPLHDYSALYKKLDYVQGEILDCRVHSAGKLCAKTIEQPLGISMKSDMISAKKGEMGGKLIRTIAVAKDVKNNSDLPNVLNDVSLGEGVQDERYFLKINCQNNVCEPLVKIKCLDRTTKVNDRKKVIECYKCDYCPLMTLKKPMMDLHKERRGACASDLRMMKCPGCANVFSTTMCLRIHLQHDHNMPAKDVRYIMQNLNRIRVVRDVCVYVPGERTVLSGDGYSSPDLQLVLPTGPNGELTDLSQERSSCAKRPTMLETYLDGISNKNDEEVPPRLSQSGADLLENTFNFTAPVSEQLPSIQPENPPGSGDIEVSLMEDNGHMDLNGTHLLEHPADQSVGEQYMLRHVGEETQCLEHAVNGQNLMEGASGGVNSDHVGESMQERHLLETAQTQGFLGMANVFDQREENRYKESQPSEYLFISSDIPVIQLDDKGVPEFDLAQYTSEPARNESTSLDEKKTVAKKFNCGFRCDINGCKFRMQSEENIEYHRRCHEGKLYNCPECCKDCPTWISLSSHLWQAHKIDMELYKCDLCPYRTPSYSRLTNIHRGIHGSTRPFLCDICGKGFKTVKQMRNHKIIHRAKMVRMSSCFCNICGRTIADKRLLEQHINHLHKKQKPFLCSICGYSTAVKNSLLVHMRKHTGEKPYKCEKCEYKTADHNALRRHRMKHSGAKNYKCSQCSYSCIQSTTYKAHIKLKHPALEAELIFSCSQCNFQTLQRGSYLSHTSEHGNNKIADAAAAAFYTDSVELGPIMSERVVETIVDLSGAQSLLPDDYYEVEVEGITEN